MRNTDKDWLRLGEEEPYWGVLTHPEFRTGDISPDAMEALYSGGAELIDGVASRLRHLFTDFEPEKALDFGCGVGRLTFAMGQHAGEVCGVDISAGMLRKAEERKEISKITNVRFSEEIPREKFQWINSYIVFQHIPPPRGYPLLTNLLSTLSDGGFVSLHFIFARDLKHQRSRRLDLQNGFFNLRVDFEKIARRPVGTVMMYDYDMNTILKCLFDRGLAELELVHTDHDGHHGCWIIGRK